MDEAHDHGATPAVSADTQAMLDDVRAKGYVDPKWSELILTNDRAAAQLDALEPIELRAELPEPHDTNLKREPYAPPWAIELKNQLALAIEMLCPVCAPAAIARMHPELIPHRPSLVVDGPEQIQPLAGG